MTALAEQSLLTRILWPLSESSNGVMTKNPTFPLDPIKPPSWFSFAATRDFGPRYISFEWSKRPLTKTRLYSMAWASSGLQRMAHRLSSMKYICHLKTSLTPFRLTSWEGRRAQGLSFPPAPSLDLISISFS